MTFRKFTALSIAVLLALAVVGCGSKKDDTASSGDQSEKQSVANPDASSTTTSEPEGSGSGSSGGSSTTADSGGLGGLNGISGDCLSSYQAFSALVAEPLGFITGATQEQLDQFEQDTKDLEGKVPAEVKDDFKTVADAYKAYAQALKDIDFGDLFNPDTRQKFEDANAKIASPEVHEAQQRVQDYFVANCK